jgi:hypothetical protein
LTRIDFRRPLGQHESDSNDLRGASVQLGESVNIGIMPDQEDEVTCPFSHDQERLELKNQLGGIGTTLGNNLKSGKGIQTAAAAGYDFTSCDTIADPRDRQEDAVKVIAIIVNGEVVTNNDYPIPYPLTCAAHHLIPAQESLKGHKILKFMCKSGENQDFRNSKNVVPAAVAGSLVWGNIGYNINGGQNGAWLPGNYAVGAGAGGIGLWIESSKSKEASTGGSKKKFRMSEEDRLEVWKAGLVDLDAEDWERCAADPEEENVEAMLDGFVPDMMGHGADYYGLTGKNYHISSTNPKWSYVKAAMDAIGGQFHDRHEPYSEEVKSYLTKIYTVLATAYEKFGPTGTEPCNACKTARGKDAVKLVGPPYRMIARLNAASGFFRTHVETETITVNNIYTSNWVKAWVDDQEKSKNK